MNGKQMLEMIARERMTTGKFATQNRGLRNHIRKELEDTVQEALDENLKKIFADWEFS